MSLDKEIEKEKGLPTAAIVGVVVVIAAVVVYIVMTQKQKFEPVVAGSQAIEFTLPDLDGYSKSLSDYKGKVVFLNFWASWCDPCKEEMPSMQALYEELAGAGSSFEIVAVSVDSESAEVVREFTDSYGITFPILHDRKGKIKEIYKTTGVPETFIIDQNGYVAEKVMGPRDWSSPAATYTIRDLIQNGPKRPESYKRKKG